MGERQVGFTVIEVTLFIAVSGLLFLIAVIGTGATMRTIRFTDSGRSLVAFIQKQYDDLLNGVNTRPDGLTCSGGVVASGSQPVGTSNCLLMGRLVLFRPGDYRLSVYNIVGSEPANPDYNRTDEQLIADFNPMVATAVGSSDYSIPWQARISGIDRQSDSQATNALAIIRSPRSSRIVQYTFKTTEPVPASLSSIVSSAENVGKTTNFCINSVDAPGNPAKIVVGDAPNQTAVNVVFETTTGDCDGA